jgi:hypothetical protein
MSFDYNGQILPSVESPNFNNMDYSQVCWCWRFFCQGQGFTLSY